MYLECNTTDQDDTSQEFGGSELTESAAELTNRADRTNCVSGTTRVDSGGGIALGVTRDDRAASCGGHAAFRGHSAASRGDRATRRGDGAPVLGGRVPCRGRSQRWRP